MRVLVITPTYDEAPNIEEMLRRTRASMPDADILVVDDNSPDGTAAIARRVARRLRVVAGQPASGVARCGEDDYVVAAEDGDSGGCVRRSDRGRRQGSR